MRSHRLCVLFSLVGLACEDSTSGPQLITAPDAADAVMAADLGPVDGMVDMTLADAALDLGQPDVSVVDATPMTADAAIDAAPDLALADAAPIDAAPIDATPDAGPTCGDGIVEGPEACDDGNAGGGDYCAPDCSAVTGRCGDGVVQAIERCDDGQIVEGCDATHDGGDGTCVPLDACVDGYLLEGDDCVPIEATAEIEIFVANDCTMQVVPPTYAVARGRTVRFTYVNRSRDYPVDVWLSYGGGFLDLPIGQSWDDRFVHCAGPRRPRQAFADISTACSDHRFVIDCL